MKANALALFAVVCLIAGITQGCHGNKETPADKNAAATSADKAPDAGVPHAALTPPSTPASVDKATRAAEPSGATAPSKDTLRKAIDDDLAKAKAKADAPAPK
jgi:hypothetical protein